MNANHNRAASDSAIQSPRSTEIHLEAHRLKETLFENSALLDSLEVKLVTVRRIPAPQPATAGAKLAEVEPPAQTPFGLELVGMRRHVASLNDRLRTLLDDVELS